MRTFNTAGPIVAEDHYHIPPLTRIDLDEVRGLVRGKKYFTLHAPRQTGKTSTLLALRDLLNGQGYHCVYATVETARTARGDVERAIRAVLGQLAEWAQVTLADDHLEDAWPDILAKVGPDKALGTALRSWAEASSKPLVLLIDEIDTLQGDSLLSVLQQLRAGYPMRPAHFPQCVVLCGLRDMRDYRIESMGSPFNIAAKSLRLVGLHAGGDLGVVGPAHGGDRAGLRPRGTASGVGADPRPALAGERAGGPRLLQERFRPGSCAAGVRGGRL